MRRGSAVTQVKSRSALEKRVTLTVVPPRPGSGQNDVIRVETCRQPAPGKRRSQRRFALFLVVVLSLMILPMVRDGVAYFHLTRQYQALQSENQDLMVIQHQLKEELADLDNPVTIEKLARENLGLVMPGESKVYQAIPRADIPKQVKIQAGEVIH